MTVARRRALVLAAAFLAAILPALARQNPVSIAQDKPPAPPVNGAISGVVVDGASGNLVSGAIVTLQPSPGVPLPDGYAARQMTDSHGRFVFLNLPDGPRYQITAAKYGYLDGGYGLDSAPTDSLRAIGIAAGSWRANLRVPLWLPASISGTVRDESGEPVVGVFVRAIARIRVAGRNELAAGPTTVTDDHGQYRLSGLMGGSYVIQVPSPQASVPAGTRLPTQPSNQPEGAIDVDDTARLVIGRFPLPPPNLEGRARAYPPAFHPTALAVADAAIITLAFGDSRTGTDVTLTPVPAVRVSGVVEGPPEALASLTLRLLPAGMESLGLGAEVATTAVASNGSFTFLNVPGGTYTLDAPVTLTEYSIASGPTQSGGFAGSFSRSLPAPPPARGMSWNRQSIDGLPAISLTTSDYRGASGDRVPLYSARVPVTVGGADVTGVTVRLRPGAAVHGYLKLDLDPAKTGVTPPPRFFAFMDPAMGQSSLGRPSTSFPTSDAEFEMEGLQPGEYFLRMQGGTGWIVKSIQWRGRDYTSVPFDTAVNQVCDDILVTMTNAVPTLTGSVRAPDGSTPDSALAVVFPATPSLRSNSGLWSPRMASTPVQANGRFIFSALPAGDYLVAAIDRSRAASWRDPDVLAVLERQAARVTLAWGQASNQDVSMAVIR